jgi:hypothetical protein
MAGRLLIFNPTTDSVMIQVDILDDSRFEVSPENFTAILTSTVPRLTLLPDVATVDILDDDRKQ